MFRTWQAAVLTSATVAVVGALAVPDYSRDTVAMLFKPFVLPSLVALPLAIAAFRSPHALSTPRAILLCVLFLLVHAMVSAAIFWWRAGSALFDGISIPILTLTFGVGVVTASIVFALVWVNLRKRSRHAG